MFRSLKLYAYAAVLGLLALGSVGHAQTASPHNQKPDIKTDLIVGGVDAKESQYAWVGVRVALGPGWKTYWKSPGDGGLPPEFEWSQSSNLKGAEIQWPTPLRMTILGVETIGYTHEVVFPVRIRINDPERETRLSLKLTVYACSTICVREERYLTGTILSGSSDNGSQSVIDGWRARVPRSAGRTASATASLRARVWPRGGEERRRHPPTTPPARPERQGHHHRNHGFQAPLAAWRPGGRARDDPSRSLGSDPDAPRAAAGVRTVPPAGRGQAQGAGRSWLQLWLQPRVVQGRPARSARGRARL